MADLDTPRIDETSQAALEAETEARLKRYSEGLNGLIQHRAEHAKALEEQRAINPDLAAHIERAARATEVWGKGRTEAAEGKTSRRRISENLGKDWAAIFSDNARNTLAEVYRKTGGPVPGGEADWLRAAFDTPFGGFPIWDGTSSLLGWEVLTPVKVKPKDEDVGTVQQGLGDPPQPISLCIGPPYAFQNTASTTTGLAFANAGPSATPSSGRIFLLSSTIAPIFAGGGTDSSARVGSDISWGPGFQTMSVTAEINLGISSLFAVAILGGAAASAELFLNVAMSDGRNFRQSEGLGSAVAPLLWHTSVSQSGQHTVTVGNIPLNGAAGTARLMAGAHDNTAAVGIVGSSGATTLVSATITKICASLS
jgi:hypothetical protein